MKPMTPLRAKMIRHMQLERLAPGTRDASVEAVAGLAKFYWCPPDRLDPEQIAGEHFLEVNMFARRRSCHKHHGGKSNGVGHADDRFEGDLDDLLFSKGIEQGDDHHADKGTAIR